MDPEDPLDPLEAALREAGFDLADHDEALYAVKLKAIRDLVEAVYYIARRDVESQVMEDERLRLRIQHPYNPYNGYNTKDSW